MTSKADGSTPVAKGLDGPRLIERAFPLKQASLDSVHEKNVRHGHISTLHIWPARRPLAACRAALIATLLPDPGTPEKRKEILERLAGKIVQVPKKTKLPNGQVKVEYKDETVGGILHWGRESGPDLEWFRKEIRKAYGGRAPRVLDPFAGGGAIPLEAMRLGCDVTASDINPVAWFILKCTLEYPQKLAGQKRPLPRFALESKEVMREYWKVTGKYSKKELDAKVEKSQTRLMDPPEADLAWHVRAWGHWVLERAGKDLEKYYPTVDGKPTVAYLWARTVTCKNCRATIPLLKTRWLCKKDNKRVLLTMGPNRHRTGVVFGIHTNVPVVGGNAAQRREHDKRMGQGTMSGSGVTCPCCSKPESVAMTLEDIQLEHQAGRAGDDMLTCVVVNGPSGKEYRTPISEEAQAPAEAARTLDVLYHAVPGGIPREPIDAARPSPNARGLSGLPTYGLDRFDRLFNQRQLFTLGTLVKCSRALRSALSQFNYPPDWIEAIIGYVAIAVDRLADRNTTICHWDMGRETISNTFQRYALRINWDYAEVNPFAHTTGSYLGAVDWIARVGEHVCASVENVPQPQVICSSATNPLKEEYDLVLTDPPYYDAIPYSDLSDFFYVWLRRTIGDLYPDVFASPLTTKTQELVQHAGRMGGDNDSAKRFYEEGMAQAFAVIKESLLGEGRLVIVFAHKQPDAWETLVSAIIRTGFVVDASWPIQTEMPNKAAGGARLASSVWLVCRKRPESARPGWDNQVLAEMESKIHERLREYWDAGIRGPDFVWAATGPALEAYSLHPIVKKANEPGAVITVSEFLRHVRRIVVDFVVGRVLSKDGDGTSASGLDDLTTYYLLHRHDFGFGDAPAGACILYAVSCGLSDTALSGEYDLLVRTGGIQEEENEEESDEEEGEIEEGSGSTMRLKRWDHRRGKNLGLDTGGRPTPLIDRIHHLLQLWRSGDVTRVDDYLGEYGLGRNAIFHQVLQALIELSEAGSEERSLLESVSNHIAAKGGTVKKPKTILEYTDSDSVGGRPE